MTALFLILMLAQADPDAEGCRDAKMLSRKPGCVIESCANKAFDGLDILMGKANGQDQLKSLEGETEEVHYRCAPSVSGLEITRQAAGALRSAGFQLIYTGKDSFEEQALSAQKGNAWLTIRTNSEGRYSVSSVVVKPVAQELTAQWKSELESSGRVAVYGIEFDTASAQLRPEADGVLNQILVLLEGESALRLRIEGHTDTTGTPAANQQLSAQRAAAVALWLSRKGIAASRLETAGKGSIKPIAPNDTEEGRSRNRRVELVRLP